jgi:hypothetical protein
MIAPPDRGHSPAFFKLTAAGDSFHRLRRKSEWIRKIQVQCDENAPSVTACVVDHLVSTSGQILIAHGVYIVTPSQQQRDDSDIEVLIQLEHHECDDSTGMGITRSRVISAA